MKKLSIKSTEIFDSIYNLLDGKGSLKLNNAEGAYMPLYVEKVGAVKMKEVIFEKISFAHYYEQNGDLCQDPEMIFLYNRDLKIVIPCYFLQANVLEEESIVFDKNNNCIGCRIQMQAAQVKFAEMWLANIKEQQDL